MSSFSGKESPKQKAKAVTLVILVHILLGAAILSGLNVEVVRKAVENLTTVAVIAPTETEPVVEAKPKPVPERAKDPQGRAGKKAERTPVVAPQAPAPSPVTAAQVAGTGAAPSAGAALAGSGTGAGGSGSGNGGGGLGDTSGFTPARLIRNLGPGDYRALTGNRIPKGSADAHIAIDKRGRVAGCTLITSSGDVAVDAALCPLIARRLRFAPARDAAGNPIAFNTNYRASWRLGY